MAGTTSRSGGPRTGRVGRHEGVLGAAVQASRREAAAPAVALHRPRADSGAEGAQQPRILGVARGRLPLSPGRGLRSPGVPQAQQQPPRPRADPLSRQPARGDPRGRRAGASRQAGPEPRAAPPASAAGEGRRRAGAAGGEWGRGEEDKGGGPEEGGEGQEGEGRGRTGASGPEGGERKEEEGRGEGEEDWEGREGGGGGVSGRKMEAGDRPPASFPGPRPALEERLKWVKGASAF